MRVLLDENVDRLLKPLFETSFDVKTVRGQGWTGTQNGELLKAAEEAIDVLVTMDRNMPYQQNLKVLDLAVVVIRARSNAYIDVAPQMPKVNRAIQEAEPDTATFV